MLMLCINLPAEPSANISAKPGNIEPYNITQYLQLMYLKFSYARLKTDLNYTQLLKEAL